MFCDPSIVYMFPSASSSASGSQNILKFPSYLNEQTVLNKTVSMLRSLRENLIFHWYLNNENNHREYHQEYPILLSTSGFGFGWSKLNSVFIIGLKGKTRITTILHIMLILHLIQLSSYEQPIDHGLRMPTSMTACCQEIFLTSQEICDDSIGKKL